MQKKQTKLCEILIFAKDITKRRKKALSMRLVHNAEGVELFD
jgi:hypothetical protein